MNTWMIKSYSRSFLMSLVSLLVLASACRAVELADQDVSSNEKASLMFDLDFPGGSLSDLADLISRKDPGYKFILNGDVGGSPMPALQIERIDVDGCLWLIDSIVADLPSSKHEIWSSQRSVRDGSDLVVFGRDLRKASRRGGSVRGDSSSTAIGEDQMIEIYSIAHLLDRGLSAEMILSDLENIELVNGGPLGLRSALINDETSLLFIKGGPSIQRLVASLMDALDESVRFIRHDDRPVKKSEPLGKESAAPQSTGLLTDVQIELLDTSRLRDHIRELSILRRQHSHDADMMKLIQSRFNSVMDELHKRSKSQD